MAVDTGDDRISERSVVKKKAMRYDENACVGILADVDGRQLPCGALHTVTHFDSIFCRSHDVVPGARENALKYDSLAATFFQRPRVILLDENGVHL